MYQFNGLNYHLMENYRNAFDETLVREKMTDYFNDFDYIIGDWSYGKLRLKGFCSEDNKRRKSYNLFSTKEVYLKDYCAPNAAYFILEKK